MSLQVTPFEPDLFTFFKADWDEVLLRHTEGGLGLIVCFSNLSESSRDVRGLRFFVG